ncbi:MAG: helix-turn-helix transcriptional regulator, partial [Armatimonadetes bacterium]|nr:helix-turn-helix transcriptional regulator [Armatimonadota bacterium]
MIKDRLRIAREFERLTQSQLAERAGVSRSAIGDIEAGRRDEPSGEFIEAVAAATGFPIRFFTSKHALPDIRDGRFRQ